MLKFTIIIAILYKIFLFYKHGKNYTKGMCEYAKFNNVPQNLKSHFKQENFLLSIKNEFNELIDAIKNLNMYDIIMEFYDVLHSIIKMFIITILPKEIYCDELIWIPVFFIVSPVAIKLSQRYKSHGCIRNHNNKNNCSHNCNYYK